MISPKSQRLYICTIQCNWNLINGWMGLQYGLWSVRVFTLNKTIVILSSCRKKHDLTVPNIQIKWQSIDWNPKILRRRNERTCHFISQLCTYIIHPDSKMIYKWNKMEINVTCMMFSKHYQNNHCIGVVFQTNCGHVWF